MDISVSSWDTVFFKFQNFSQKELENVNKRYVIEGDNELTMYGGSVNQIELTKLLKSDLNFTISWIKADDNS